MGLGRVLLRLMAPDPRGPATEGSSAGGRLHRRKREEEQLVSDCSPYARLLSLALLLSHPRLFIRATLLSSSLTPSQRLAASAGTLGSARFPGPSSATQPRMRYTCASVVRSQRIRRPIEQPSPPYLFLQAFEHLDGVVLLWTVFEDNHPVLLTDGRVNLVLFNLLRVKRMSKRRERE